MYPFTICSRCAKTSNYHPAGDMCYSCYNGIMYPGGKMYCPQDCSPYNDNEENEIIDLMSSYSNKANREIASICNPLFSTDITKVLAFAYQNEDVDAIRLCQMLQIGDLEISAVIEDKKWFKEALIEKNSNISMDWE